MIMPTRGQPTSTTRIPPMKAAVPFNLCCWKKNLKVRSSPITSERPLMKRICKENNCRCTRKHAPGLSNVHLRQISRRHKQDCSIEIVWSRYPAEHAWAKCILHCGGRAANAFWAFLPVNSIQSASNTFCSWTNYFQVQTVSPVCRGLTTPVFAWKIFASKQLQVGVVAKEANTNNFHVKINFFQSLHSKIKTKIFVLTAPTSEARPQSSHRNHIRSHQLVWPTQASICVSFRLTCHSMVWCM